MPRSWFYSAFVESLKSALKIGTDDLQTITVRKKLLKNRIQIIQEIWPFKAFNYYKALSSQELEDQSASSKQPSDQMEQDKEDTSSDPQKRKEPEKSGEKENAKRQKES